ncbi:hypothetical protein [Undibacterium sp. TC9W]|uniref:hypothetical protein n=1 Tax=Undibacterium sp. TC9W TaxID=3413053 RepID=UPI003BF07083
MKKRALFIEGAFLLSCAAHGISRIAYFAAGITGWCLWLVLLLCWYLPLQLRPVGCLIKHRLSEHKYEAYPVPGNDQKKRATSHNGAFLFAT